MRVALVHFLDNRTNDDNAVIENLKNASAKSGNDVTIVNGLDSGGQNPLMLFEYIAVLIRPEGLFSAGIPDTVMKFLGSAGTLSGKKGCALVLKSGLRSMKTCRNLMENLETAGLRLDYFDVIRDAGHALSVGTKVG